MRNESNRIVYMLSLIFLLGFATQATASEFIEIRVFASEATAKPVKEIGYIFEKEHPKVQLHYEFTASRVFYIGIMQGIPPDLFISAGTKLQDRLSDAGFINFADTVAYSRLVVATTCFPPPCCRAPGAIPLKLTHANVLGHLMSAKGTLTVPSPVLSVAGRYTDTYFKNLERRMPEASDRIHKHAVYVMNPGLVARALEERNTQVGILYRSQVFGMRRVGLCVNAVPLPGSPRIPFTVAVLNKSRFHFISPEREKLDKELKALYLSKTGQETFARWGFETAKQ